MDKMSEFLAEIFSSRVRAAVLAYLLPRHHLAFSLTDLARALDVPISSLQHECYKLERLGLLVGRREGNARRYRVNSASPWCGPLAGLVAAVIGRRAVLRAALAEMPGLELAFMTDIELDSDGVVHLELGDEPARLVLIGLIPLDELTSALVRVEAALALPPGTIGLAFFQPAPWCDRVQSGDRYVADLLARRSITLHGTGRGCP